MTPSIRTRDNLSEHPLFAFYGRVSTEDQQDPQASHDRQIIRARQLIEPAGGTIAAEYFDISHTRALPWQRRPYAQPTAGRVARPDRGFQALVIGEPQRAFYANQFSLTFPVFEQFGVQLWVPEVGGAIDPGSEAHDPAMTVFGSMSMHTLEPDPDTAPVVLRIFTMFLDGCGYLAIAERLTAEHLPHPRAMTGSAIPIGWGWRVASPRSARCCQNPRYTGYQMWTKQRRDEVLLDVDDAAAGHVTRMRWTHATSGSGRPNRPARRWSAPRPSTRCRPASPPAHGPAPPRADLPPAVCAAGRLLCGLCRGACRASGATGRPTTAAAYPSGPSAGFNHAGNVYLREADLTPKLDAWLARLVSPAGIEATCRRLAAAQSTGPPTPTGAPPNRPWPTASASSPATARRWGPAATRP